MKTTVVVGTQWGDEGKGKLVDIMAESADWVIRFHGGANAGHTLWVQGQKTVLHLIPSGVLHAHTRCLIGPGVALDPFALIEEIRGLKSKGFLKEERQLLIADQCTLILPIHKALDQAREKSLLENKIGTTGKGIGPAYEDRASRRAITLADLYQPRLEEKLNRVLEEKNLLLEFLYKESLHNPKDLVRDLVGLAAELAPYRTSESSRLLIDAKNKGQKILFEGAQGSLLDVVHGNYPFVTSSSTLAGSVSPSLGLGPKFVDHVVGVFKAYCTRVGSGPMPTELKNEVGAKIQKDGQEFGSTTGRVRRCGWLDLVALKYAIDLNGVDELAMMKLDVLSGHEKVAFATKYRIGAVVKDSFPTALEDLENSVPELEWHESWSESLIDCRAWEDLPGPAKNYIRAIESHVQCPISRVSVGPDRAQILKVPRI